jgi:anion-transporting  ArsA/GET3 family ATPase
MARSKIIFITGKGGVGKTTISCHLGQAAAQLNIRTLLVEVNGSKQIPFYFGTPEDGYNVIRVSPNLSCISITPQDAIEDYILQQIHSKRIYKLVFQNRLVQPLLNGAPGLHNAVQIGKIYELCTSGDWDLIIVDAPATGHGITMIDAAKHMVELTRMGPMYDSNVLVDEVISDTTNTGILMVSTPERLPVKECIDLYQRLPSNRQKGVLGAVINQYEILDYPPNIEHDLKTIGPTETTIYTQYLTEHNCALKLEQTLPVPVFHYPYQQLDKANPQLDNSISFLNKLMGAFKDV